MEISNCKERGSNVKYGSTKSYTPLYRQIFVCSGITVYFFMYGLFLGAPTVYIPQIRREANSTDIISMSTASWLSSISSYSSAPWSIILTVLAQHFGRKNPYTVLWFVTVAAALLFYFSTSVTELFVSAMLQGVICAIGLSVSVLVLTEYTSPRYRGLFMTCKSATIFWGIWVSNAIGTYFHWRNISLVILICLVFNISVFFWPQSPYWLASQGRFRECESYHRWLKGDDNASLKELQELVSSQRRRLNRKTQCDTKEKRNFMIKLYRILKSKNFYKPIATAMLTVCLYYCSGKMACTIYAIDIIKQMTESESTAYKGMLILDGITVLGMYIGCVLCKFLKRRTLLLSTSSIGVTFLLILSLYLYIVKLGIVTENKFLSLTLLTIFSITISCGPMIMAMCLSGELAPIKYRNLYISVFAVLTNIMMATVLKVAPYMFAEYGSHGAFLFYGLSTLIFVILLYIYLPETKDKTIFEIEKIMMGCDHESNSDCEIDDDRKSSLYDHNSLIDDENDTV